MTGYGLTLDAGALIAVDRGDQRTRSTIEQALGEGRPVHVVAGALAQAWRGGPRQARLARLLNRPGVTLVDLSPDAARLVGELMGRCGHADVTDVHVVLHARQHDHIVVTSDPEDLGAVDPGLTVIAV